jgi:hypothetical protein
LKLNRFVGVLFQKGVNCAVGSVIVVEGGLILCKHALVGQVRECRFVFRGKLKIH